MRVPINREPRVRSGPLTSGKLSKSASSAVGFLGAVYIPNGAPRSPLSHAVRPGGLGPLSKRFRLHSLVE